VFIFNHLCLDTVRDQTLFNAPKHMIIFNLTHGKDGLFCEFLPQFINYMCVYIIYVCRNIQNVFSFFLFERVNVFS